MNQAEVSDTKKCSKCQEVKPITEFYYRRDHNNFRKDCKKCFHLRHKKYIEKNFEYFQQSKHDYYFQNKEKAQIYKKQYQIKNKQKLQSKYKLYYQQNKEKLLTQSHEYYQKRKDTASYKKGRSLYVMKLRQNNLGYKLLSNMRHRINMIIKENIKYKNTYTLLGCEAIDFKKYLENQFTNGMSWENYGNKKDQWSIDHIIPCSFFNMVEPIEQKYCFHYTNCRPLWHKENILKKDTLLKMNYNDPTPFI